MEMIHFLIKFKCILAQADNFLLQAFEWIIHSFIKALLNHDWSIKASVFGGEQEKTKTETENVIWNETTNGFVIMVSKYLLSTYCVLGSRGCWRSVLQKSAWHI